MGTLSTLLRWKKSITLTDDNGNTIKDDEGKPVVVWVRIISDKDLEDAFKAARIASARIRASLLNEETEDYQVLIEPFNSASRDQCYDMALAGLGANWMSEAISTVVRPDLVTIKDVAIDPDASTLEEQERVDADNRKAEEDYNSRLLEFIETKTVVARAELDELTDEELRERAKDSVIITVPLETFLNQLEAEKIWRAIYHDEACKVRGFDSLEDYQSSKSIIKNQLSDAYDNLESGHKDVKN